MKPGDLRRFHSDIAFESHLAGCSFMVLEMVKGAAGWCKVTILADGKVEGPWDGPWVEQNSEALDAAR